MLLTYTSQSMRECHLKDKLRISSAAGLSQEKWIQTRAGETHFAGQLTPLDQKSCPKHSSAGCSLGDSVFAWEERQQ